MSKDPARRSLINALMCEMDGACHEGADAEHEDLLCTPTMPSMAFHGIAGRFVAALRDSTEAPPEFLLAAFLTVVALLIGRLAWIIYSRPTYPNLYTLLVGETASSRKTTAMGFALDLMTEIAALMGGKLKTLYGLASVEGLADAMKDKDSEKPYRIIAIEDEFKSLMRKAQQKGVSNLVPRLTELYNCAKRFEVNTRNNRVSIEDPFLCMVSASTSAWFAESIGDSEISGGFLNRWGMFSSKPASFIPFPTPPNHDTWHRLVQDLAGVIQDARGEYLLTAEAREIFTEFYGLLRKRNEGGLRGEATVRADLHAIKYSLLYAQDRHDGIFIVLLDAQKTVQDRRRCAFVRRLYDTLQWANPRLLKIEGAMVSR